MKNDNDKLPYAFDLLLDIKTKKELQEYYAQIKWEYEILTKLIKDYEVKGVKE